MVGDKADQRVVEPRKIIGKIQVTRARKPIGSVTIVVRY